MADWQLWLPPALTKPRFRIYAAGHTVSVIGGWIQQVALSWLVFRLTGSIFLLGVAGFLLNIFYLLLGPVGGLAADRLPRLQAADRHRPGAGGLRGAAGRDGAPASPRSAPISASPR